MGAAAGWFMMLASSCAAAMLASSRVPEAVPTSEPVRLWLEAEVRARAGPRCEPVRPSDAAPPLLPPPLPAEVPPPAAPRGHCCCWPLIWAATIATIPQLSKRAAAGCGAALRPVFPLVRKPSPRPAAPDHLLERCRAARSLGAGGRRGVLRMGRQRGAVSSPFLHPAAAQRTGRQPHSIDHRLGTAAAARTQKPR